MSVLRGQQTCWWEDPLLSIPDRKGFGRRAVAHKIRAYRSRRRATRRQSQRRGPLPMRSGR